MSNSTYLKVEMVVRSVFPDHCGDVTPQSSSIDIDGWDSLGHINLVIALEQEFKVRLRPAKLARLKSLKDIAKHLEEKRL